MKCVLYLMAPDLYAAIAHLIFSPSGPNVDVESAHSRMSSLFLIELASGSVSLFLVSI